MLRNFLRGLTGGLGFWLTPIALLIVLAGAGIAAGYSAASAAPTPSVVARMVPRDPANGITGGGPIRQPINPSAGSTVSPETAAGAPAPRRNAVDATIVRPGVRVPEGQLYIVKDKSNRQFRILVTAQTVVRREGQRLSNTTLQPNDRIVGVGTRQLDGVFRVTSISIMPTQQ